MKISILTPDLSNNCLGRSYLLAKILRRRYDVEMLGPIFGKTIWEPVSNDNTIEYKTVMVGKGLTPYLQLTHLYKKIDGDVILASKPLFTSFGIGLLKKVSASRPLVLDIDDWQMGFIRERDAQHSRNQRIRSLLVSLLLIYKMRSFWNNLIFEKLHSFADEIIVSNTFLKDKFGGTVVWHGRDTNAFDPCRYDKTNMRFKYKIDMDKKIVMFLGTPRKYKGIEDLINAVHLLNDRNIVLMVVGIDFDLPYASHLVDAAQNKLGPNFKGYGMQKFHAIPEYLAMADVVVIPQKNNLATIGQMPAKVFDAMAMAKPIVATAVSDLPKILSGCGYISPPDNPEKLSETIQFAIQNSGRSDELGTFARERCVKNYSWDSMEAKLYSIFKKYE
jgi:glycosyltransferase involved in cell wall biosynthesis